MAEGRKNPTCIKLVSDDEMRRIMLKDVNIECITKLVEKVFPNKLPNVKLSYRDDEGDVITLSTDEELDEFLRISRERCPKLYIGAVPPLSTAKDAGSVKVAILLLEC